MILSLSLLAAGLLLAISHLGKASSSNEVLLPDDNPWEKDGANARVVVGGETRTLIRSVQHGKSNVFISPTDDEMKSNEKGSISENFVPKEDKDDETVTSFIVGGSDVTPREFKFFAWLGNCGASLVAPNVVLSAAHCFGNVNDFVTLGMHKIRLNADEAAEYNNIEHIPIAEWWSSSLYAGNTIALDTPTDDLVLANTSDTDLIVMGFGMLESASTTGPNVMQKVVVDYISNEACVSEPYQYFPPEITPVMLCAKRTGKDSCQGDSGGPILDVTSGTQVGIVSFGGGGCNHPYYPGVYARVASDGYNFIYEHITKWNNPDTRPSNSWAKRTTPTTTEHVLGCTDEGGFYDNRGVMFNCMWYAGTDSGASRCSEDGNRFTHAGLTANMACCVCRTSMPTSRPSTTVTSKPPVTENEPSCGQGIIDCDYGYVRGSTVTCASACEGKCCVGTDACKGFTGKVSMGGSCGAIRSCLSATIPLVCNSCKGEYSCAHAGGDGGPNPSIAGRVGKIINSCHENQACEYVGHGSVTIRDGQYVIGREGGAGDIINSCTRWKSCYYLGGSMYSPVTQNLVNCCNDDYEQCTGFRIHGDGLPAACQKTVSPSSSATTRTPTANSNTHKPTLMPTTSPMTRKPSTKKPSNSPTKKTQKPKPRTKRPTTRKPRTKRPTTQKPTRIPTNTPTTQTPTNKPTTKTPTNKPTTRTPTNKPTTKTPTNKPIT